MLFWQKKIINIAISNAGANGIDLISKSKTVERILKIVSNA